MRTHKGTIIVISAVSLGAIALAGCSSTTSTSSSSSSASSSMSPKPSTASPTESASSSMSGVPAPIMVTPGQKTAMAKVGNTVVFKVDDPVKTKVVSSNDGIIKITEGYQQGSATFNPGGEALTPGVATITITTPSGSQEKVLLTIER